MSSPPESQNARANPAVIVTGGTRGIGRGIVTGFHEAGYRVLACARNEPDEALRDGEREALFMTCDVRDPEQVEAVVSADSTC
jgi:NAD(P)-dependent dehydrogenase (short-subunit alcohol dehydrogenase family)